MLIKGLQKTTLLDFPGKVACTVFTGGCNFRCPFCHNASLVLTPNMVDTIDEKDFFDYITKRKGILDGVCITGGEPLMQKDIIPFIKKIKEIGLAVKLDTNGSYHDTLKEILSLGLVDYVAMDIKNCPDKYNITVGLNQTPQDIDKSIDLLLEGNVPYEFRTTVVKELHTIEDIEKLAIRIKGAKRYYLQGFIDSGDLIATGYSAYDPEEMNRLLEVARKWIPSACLRGL